MDELTTVKVQLPDTLEDLSRFVLFTQERIKSMRAEIRAMNKLEFIKEIEEQKKQELQDLSEALIDAQVRIGELTKALPRASAYNARKTTSGYSDVVLKSETVKNLGLERYQVNEYEQMASNPEAVRQAKDEARDTERPVSRYGVMKIIEAGKPDKIIRTVCGGSEADDTGAEYKPDIYGTAFAIKLGRSITALSELLTGYFSPGECAEALINNLIAADRDGFLYCLDVVTNGLQNLKAAITSNKRMEVLK